MVHGSESSTPSCYQSDAIHRSINNKLEFIESELSAQGLSQDREHHFPALSSNSSPVAVGLPHQSAIENQASLKRPQVAAPLELAPAKETRLTQFNLSIESVPANRIPHQRVVKGTNFFGDFIQANSDLHQQRSSKSDSTSAPRLSNSRLATRTCPGRSGLDTRPGMASESGPKDFIIVPVPKAPASHVFTSGQVAAHIPSMLDGSKTAKSKWIVKHFEMYTPPLYLPPLYGR